MSLKPKTFQLEREIDRMVYSLYNLTNDKVEIVGGVNG